MGEYKNNPYVTNNTTIKSESMVTKLLALISLKKISPKARAFVASLIITASLGATLGTIVNDRIELRDSINEYVSMAPEMDAHDLIRNIKMKYGMIDGEEATTDYQIMIKTIEDAIVNNPELSNEEKRELLTNIDTDDELFSKAFTEANKMQDVGINISVHKEDTDTFKIEAIKNNPDLMSIIKEYADLFYIEKDVLVAIAAESVNNNGEINMQNLMHINKKAWSTPISGTWHIYTAKGDINLIGFKAPDNLENLDANDQIYLAAKMMCACLKDAGGDYNRAINSYNSGLNAYETSNEFNNQVLSNLLDLRQTGKTQLVYYKTDLAGNPVTYITTVKSEEYQEDFANKWEYLTEDIRAEYQSYDHLINEEARIEAVKSRS